MLSEVKQKKTKVKSTEWVCVSVLLANGLQCLKDCRDFDE